MQFDIPDAPDVIDSASESGKQEPTNVDADDNQDKMDVDIPQETSIAFTQMHKTPILKNMKRKNLNKN